MRPPARPIPVAAGGQRRWRSTRASRHALALALLASLPSLASCVTRDQDLHLSPFYSRLSSAGGGREVEAAAGIVRVRRPEPKADVNDWMVRPLVSEHYEANGDKLLRYLVPLGDRRVVGPELTARFLPIARYQRTHHEQGEDEWKLLALPGILWSKDQSGRVVRAFFPFGGVVERFFTYDRITFVLFPLFMKTEREGRTSWHFLWPIFNYASGGKGKTTFRIWPFYGEANPGSFDRRFYLWPFFHYQNNGVHHAPDKVEKRWMFWPFYGLTKRGSYTAHTVIWPLFGWSHDPKTGFWAFDGPWPFVRVMRSAKLDEFGQPKKELDPERTRIWPLFSHYRGDGLESLWLPWPIFNKRTESYTNGSREGNAFVPFWQTWKHLDLEARTTDSWQKLWPLYQRRVEQEAERFAFPALNPLWYTPVVDEHYAFIYELYTRERQGTRIRERSWGGIWRRDRDENETRTYLAGLWSRRTFKLDGSRVSESSLLFGLLRWRTQSDAGFKMLMPRVPGPGWPVARAKELAR